MHHYGTKTWIIEEVAKNAGLTKSQAQTAVDALTDAIIKGVKQHSKARLPGFGTFGVSQRKARMGRNPATGEAIKISASKVLKFKAGKMLKEAVRGKE
jgi:DNA-binding protein HU-beta